MMRNEDGNACLRSAEYLSDTGPKPVLRTMCYKIKNTRKEAPTPRRPAVAAKRIPGQDPVGGNLMWNILEPWAVELRSPEKHSAST